MTTVVRIKGPRRTGLKGERLDVQHGDLDALLAQEPDDVGADPAGPARDEDHLLAPPVVLVVGPVVEHAARVVAAEPADQADHEEGLDAGEGLLVEDGQVLALLGQAGEQEDGQREERVEGGLGEGAHDRVHLEALAGQQPVVHRHGGVLCCAVLVCTVCWARGVSIKYDSQ